MSDPYNNTPMDDFNPFDNIRVSQTLDLHHYVNAFNNNNNSANVNSNQQPMMNLNQSNQFATYGTGHLNSTSGGTNSANTNSILDSLSAHHQFQLQQQYVNNDTNGLIVSSDIQMELKELIGSLETLAQESPQHIFFLSRVLQPHVSEDLRFPLLSKMFSDVPQMIPQISFQNFLSSYYQDPNNHAFKLFMDFKELSNLLGRISYIQLNQLTNNLIPPGTPQFQYSILLKIHEYFQIIGFEKLKYFNSSLEGDSSLNNTYYHIQKIITLDSTIPIDLIHFIAGIVSLPLNELFNFHQWFIVLSKKMLSVLLALLQLDSNSVLDIKRILGSSFISTPPMNIQSSFSPILSNSTSNIINQHQSNLLKSSLNNQHNIYNNHSNINSHNNNTNNNNNLNITQNNNNNNIYNQTMPPLFPSISNSSGIIPNDHLSSPISSPVQTMSYIEPHTPPQPSSTNNNNNNNNIKPLPSSSSQTQSGSIENSFYLKIARQPPSTTVYQRILKPFPSVMLCGPGIENENLSNFFVEATLLRNDNQAELANCLDGNKISRISNGVFAPFKKLKILSTTQQQRTLFRVKFMLKRYVGSDFQSFPNAVVLSDPIEVFSHTIYLADKQDVPLPPSVTEIIPAMGPPGCRMVILGSNFSKSDDLKVSFNGYSVPATFYEKGTIICNVPTDMPMARQIQVKVTNDGDQYSNESVTFTLTSH